MDSVKEPIRILHVVTKMDAAGIETFLMNIYRNIDRNKIQFDFLTHREEPGFYDDEIKKLGGNIYTVPNINLLHHKKYLNALNIFFQQHKEYTIVHSHINALSMFALRSAKKNEVPTRIAHSHSTKNQKDYKYPIKEYCRKRITNYSTHNFACSKDAGMWLFNSENFDIIYNGIDIEKTAFNDVQRKAYKEKLKLNNKIIIGNIGRMVHPKNQIFILDILEKLLEFNIQYHLLLVGEGTLYKEISKIIKEKNLENSVTILSKRKDIPQLLSAMDYFVFPSLYEGLGIVGVESQVSGLPTFVSSHLPSELNASNLLKRISLDKDALYWADSINKTCLNTAKRNDFTYYESIKNYDIKTIFKNLENFYFKCNRKQIFD